MNHYKSWSSLNQQLSSLLCDGLQKRITYFLTRYSDIHNSHGRAAIRLDGKERVCFHWGNGIRQEYEYSHCLRSGYENPDAFLQEHWDHACILSEGDFLQAALQFRNMPIQDALDSNNWIVRVFAILDRRVGKRTLERIANECSSDNMPDWVRLFYDLRFSLL